MTATTSASSQPDRVLAAVVQHHPSRAHLLDRLLERLAPLPTQVVPDPGGPAPDTWRTHRACLEACPRDATHLLVVQDDADPCDRFAAHAQQAVEAEPDAVLVLFVPGFAFLARRMRHAEKARQAFTTLPPAAFTPVVAIIYPRHHVHGILRYTSPEGWPRARRLGTADDAIVAGYLRSTRTRTLATVPSLVDHRDDVPSVAKPAHQRGPHRRAAILHPGLRVTRDLAPSEPMV